LLAELCGESEGFLLVDLLLLLLAVEPAEGLFCCDVADDVAGERGGRPEERCVLLLKFMLKRQS